MDRQGRAIVHRMRHRSSYRDCKLLHENGPSDGDLRVILTAFFDTIDLASTHVFVLIRQCVLLRPLQVSPASVVLRAVEVESVCEQQAYAVASLKGVDLAVVVQRHRSVVVGGGAEYARDAVVLLGVYGLDAEGVVVERCVGHVGE